MHKCVMIKIGGSQKRKFYENMGKFINLAEIGGISNMHHWLSGMDGLDALDSYNSSVNPYRCLSHRGESQISPQATNYNSSLRCICLRLFAARAGPD